MKEYRYAPYKKGIRPVDTIQALIGAYRQSPEWNNLALQTRKVYAAYLKDLEIVGHVRVRDVSRRDLITARNAILANRGPGAAQGYIRAASAVFRWAQDNEWIDINPCVQIKAIGGGELRAWTVADADRAEAGLPEHLRRVVVLARYTGQRRADLCAMTWAAFDGETIRVRQQKTGANLVIPCHPTLRTELLAWRDGDVAMLPTRSILTNTLGRQWIPQHLSHEMPVALKRLGMHPKLNVHGLRKLAATSLADAGCTTHEIAAVTGHRTLAMVQHYTLSADQERLAGSAVGKLTHRRKL